ncbi:hypothetical protein CMV_025436 [Castanea mollissima]|uniref:Uncharacterized protein n=1 Tax=Castanea mollissima TaxID=60419 RepID=A0A8J4QLK4_9ROSI|nr:hypothetical protein CMV_025436 [Castanea mollissima]
MASLAIALWNTHGVEINLMGAEPARNTEWQSKQNGMKSIKGFVNNIDSPKTETWLESLRDEERLRNQLAFIGTPDSLPFSSGVH